MGVYWSPSLGGFCHPDVLDVMPDDSVELTEDDYQALLDGQTEGKLIVKADSGLPLLQDPPPPTAEQLATSERYWRDARLSVTDSLVVRHRDEQEAGRATTLGAEQYQQLQGYRLDLRDWPDSKDFPDEAKRPAAPEWLTALLAA